MAYPRNPSGSAAPPWLPWAAALCLAAFAGLMLALVATAFGERTVYFLATAAVGGGGALVALTRREPLRFMFLALLCGLPLASALVPPGRFGVTVFDAAMLVLTIGLVGRYVTAERGSQLPLFPTRSLLVAWLLCLPCVALSHFPLLSLVTLVAMFALHTFFWFALAEQRRSNGFERLVLLLAGVLLVMALGVFADHVLRMNLSLRGANLNQLTYLAGLEIYRAGGFFQDPQRAGAFLATLVTFLLVLTLRGRFASPKIRAAIWLAIVAGLAALPLTMSRGAILACLAVSALALFVFNAWHTHVKVLVAALSITVALVVTQTSFDVWLDVLPTTMRERFLRIGEEFASRWFIWFDTWEMFAEQPLTGIGLGSFRSYLLETRPGTFNYYGIGAAAGVPYVPDQPESGYLKILYEGGLLGSLAALLVAGEAVRRGLAVIADRAASSTARTECIAALAGLTTFGLTFVTLFTIGDARLGALLALLLAVIWHRSLERAGARRV
jgi:O-antigen ligase